MDRIQELLARAQSNVEKAGVEKKADFHAKDVAEGPEMPPSMPTSSGNERGDASPTSPRSPRRGRRERSPLRDYGRHSDRSPSRSPQRKKYRGRSPRRNERSPPRGHRRDYRDYRDRDYHRGRPYRERTPSPGRLRRLEMEERDKKFNVIKEEREDRTILVQGLPLDVFERAVEDFFEQKSVPVRDVQLVVDRQRKFNGIAYLELYRKEDVEFAVKLNGESLDGKELSISKADLGASASSSYGSSSSQYGQGGSNGGYTGGYNDRQRDAPRSTYGEIPLRLYIGNLDYGVTQEMVRDILQQFGPLESVKLQTDEMGKSKGHAFAQFSSKEHALAAFHQLNTTILANRQIRCDFTNDARQRDPDLPPSPPMVSSRTTYYPSSGTAQGQPNAPAQNSRNGQNGTEALEEEFSNNSSMHSLIQRLAASTSANGSASITAANISTGAPTQLPQEDLSALLVPQVDRSSLPSPGTPSTCVLLKNLFDPSTESSPDFDKEIEEDVRGEAEKFGPVLHIFVDKNSFGDVFMQFKEVHAAEATVDLLHGRFFAGRLVRAEYILKENYHFTI